VQLYRYFVSQSSEFCRHKPLCCFSTSVVVVVYFVMTRSGNFCIHPRMCVPISVFPVHCTFVQLWPLNSLSSYRAHLSKQLQYVVLKMQEIFSILWRRQNSNAVQIQILSCSSIFYRPTTTYELQGPNFEQSCNIFYIYSFQFPQTVGPGSAISDTSLLQFVFQLQVLTFSFRQPGRVL
jgi:hypothetical protein